MSKVTDNMSGHYGMHGHFLVFFLSEHRQFACNRPEKSTSARLIGLIPT